MHILFLFTTLFSSLYYEMLQMPILLISFRQHCKWTFSRKPAGSMFLQYDLRTALQYIGKQRSDLILCLYHRAAFGSFAVQSDRVKLALRRTYAAADALILIDYRSPAAQTSRSFDAHLLFRQRSVIIGKTLWICIRYGCRSLTGWIVIREYWNIVLVEVVIRMPPLLYCHYMFHLYLL